MIGNHLTGMMPYPNAGGVYDGAFGNNLNQFNNNVSFNLGANYQNNANKYPGHQNYNNNNGGFLNAYGGNNNNIVQNQYLYGGAGAGIGVPGMQMGMMQPYYINHQQSAADPLTQALQKLQLHATSSTDPSRSDNVYDMTAITVLIRVLVDPTLSDHHDLVMTSL